jgi:hypothetical protein
MNTIYVLAIPDSNEYGNHFTSSQKYSLFRFFLHLISAKVRFLIRKHILFSCGESDLGNCIEMFFPLNEGGKYNASYTNNKHYCLVLQLAR